MVSSVGFWDRTCNHNCTCGHNGSTTHLGSATPSRRALRVAQREERTGVREAPRLAVRRWRTKGAAVRARGMLTHGVVAAGLATALVGTRLAPTSAHELALAAAKPDRSAAQHRQRRPHRTAGRSRTAQAAEAARLQAALLRQLMHLPLQ